MSWEPHLLSADLAEMGYSKKVHGVEGVKAEALEFSGEKEV